MGFSFSEVLGLGLKTHLDVWHVINTHPGVNLNFSYIYWEQIEQWIKENGTKFMALLTAFRYDWFISH